MQWCHLGQRSRWTKWKGKTGNMISITGSKKFWHLLGSRRTCAYVDMYACPGTTWEHFNFSLLAGAETAQAGSEGWDRVVKGQSVEVTFLHTEPLFYVIIIFYFLYWLRYYTYRASYTKSGRYVDSEHLRKCLSTYQLITKLYRVSFAVS